MKKEIKEKIIEILEDFVICFTGGLAQEEDLRGIPKTADQILVLFEAEKKWLIEENQKLARVLWEEKKEISEKEYHKGYKQCQKDFKTLMKGKQII